MSCEKCKIKRGNNDAKHQEDGFDQWCITNSFGEKEIYLAIWSKFDAVDIHILHDIKYCPYCGGRIRHAKDLSNKQKLKRHLKWKAKREHISYREARKRWKKWWKAEGKARAKEVKKQFKEKKK